MNSPNPALVSQRAAQRLPRLALLLFCGAYLLPGLFGRDPWKGADITAFGYMVNMAQTHTSWTAPTVGGLPADAALLPYWIGAIFIQLLSPWIEPSLAARIPFIFLLGLTLAFTWCSTFHLARTDAAQPLPFAFGGEANPTDYARSIADGALLALIATLGLLQLGHETTPELGQLASAAVFLYALSASPFRAMQSKVAVLISLPALAASGAPSMALAMAAIGALVCSQSSYPAARRFTGWVVAGGVIAAGVSTALNAWGWRLGRYETLNDVWVLLRQYAWFMWPAWLLALWTLWRWRAHWAHRHISVPLGCAMVAVLACAAMGGSDRALMLAIPPMAVLAAFALPTLRRSTAAAIDWFSVFFFTICAMAIWVIYFSVQTGMPAKPAANVERLLPGFMPSFSALAFLLAAVATLAWLWLVHWRTGRHRHPLWKSLVLPASGVALCWLLLMTLWLPMLDYARSYRPLINRIAVHIPRGSQICAPGMSQGQLVALNYFGAYRVDGRALTEYAHCDFLLHNEPFQARSSTHSGWQLVAREHRPSDNSEVTSIYRRNGENVVAKTTN